MNRRGFTFIELTIVFAIIAILAAILFPVFARARSKAYTTSCLSNLGNIGLALKAYAQDHYGHFPPDNNNLWPLVPNYLPDSAALLCPQAQRLRTHETIRPPEAPTPGADIDYVYWGGWCDDDRPEAVIASDDVRDRHDESANYLFVDGHTKCLDIYVFDDEELRPPGWEEIDRLRLAKRGEPSSSGSDPHQ